MEKLINNILELIKIPSISGQQQEIAEVLDWAEHKLAPEKAVVHRFEFEGASTVMLLANTDGLDFDILTVGHLDVVPAEKNLFEPIVKDGKIYARGSLDMKSAVALNIEALRYAMDKDIRFGVLITTDEETTSNGIKALVKNENIKASVVFDTDAGDLYTLCDKAKHPVSIKLSAKGENAHSSRPWEGVNAVMHLIDCINDLDKDFVRYEKGGRQPENIWQDTMVVTAVNSPTTYNVVPNCAEARINFRLTEKTSLEELKNKLQAACDKHGCSYEILLSSRGVYMDCNNPEIETYKKIAEQILGRKLSFRQMCGGTDARMFSDNSVIIMHSLNGDHAHGDDEYVEIDSIYKLLEIEKKYIDTFIEKQKSRK